VNRAMGLVALFIVATICTGCGESSDTRKEPQVQTSQEQSPDPQGRYAPQPSPEDELPPVIEEAVFRATETYNITRDERWPGAGGFLANDYFEVWYAPGRATITHALRIFHDITPARDKFSWYFGQAPEEQLVIQLPITMEDYNERTGREWWHYSDLRADTLTYQPIAVLIQRGLSDFAVPHEYYQWAVGKITNYGAPRWLEEGVASYLSDEGRLLSEQLDEFPEETHAMSPDRVEEVLTREEERQDTRIAYYHAHRTVVALIDRFGEDKLKEMILVLGQGYTRDEACQKVFGLSYRKSLEAAAGTGQI
jgi:hypothetical protein